MNQYLTIQLTPSELIKIIEEAVYKAVKQIENETPVAKNETLLSLKETALLLGISPQTARTYTKKLILKGYRIGNLVKYRRRYKMSSQALRRYAENL
ncbi:MAG TPA: helix-turn-helix domain-containing protein [Bacteroidia bacterium]|jgi:hypothetical protein|nr:helix-turn-helix domain-containing protein [Bacteroidia bacterium]